MEKEKYKVIKLKQKTFDKLVNLGKPFKLGESVNEVIERVIAKFEKVNKK